MKHLKHWLVIICFLCAASSCGGEKSSQTMEIPIPAAAKPAEIDGATGSDLIRTMTVIVRSLQEKYGGFDEKVYRLPPETDRREINDFYEKAARENGWRRETDFPAENVNATVTVWRGENSGNKKTVAVAFVEIEQSSADKQKYLTIFTSR